MFEVRLVTPERHSKESGKCGNTVIVAEFIGGIEEADYRIFALHYRNEFGEPCQCGERAGYWTDRESYWGTSPNSCKYRQARSRYDASYKRQI